MEGYKICPKCDFQNDNLTSLECQKCGQDLSTVDPSFPVSPLQSNDNSDAVSSEKEGDAASKTLIHDRIRLMPKSGDYEIEIPIKGGIIGREGDLHRELFENHLYVSRIHAQLFYESACCFVVDKGSTNGTMVNDCKLEPEKRRIIKDGDIVVFADVIFRVEAVI